MPLTTNTILTREPVASLGVELLTRSLVLTNTVMRVSETEYAGSGGSVAVRVRTPRLAKVQATPGAQITFDDLVEHNVTVELTHLYNGALLADEDLSLELVDFGRQVLEPQVEAVATGAEDLLADEMNDITKTIPVGSGDPSSAVLLAREILTENLVPMGRRWLAVSPSFATALLDEDRITQVDQSGSTSALRDAMVGRLFGFTVVESPAIDDGTAIAYHESAFAAAFKAPVRPRGAGYSTTASSGGVAMRHILDYVPDRLSDASVVSTFAGAGTIYDDDGGSLGVTSLRAVGLGLGSV